MAVGAEAKWVAGYETLPDLVRGPSALPALQKDRRIVIGTVTAEREGVELKPVDEPPREVTRILTIKVDRQIMGAAAAGDTIDISTLGWVVDGDRRTPVTLDGVPWLQVGDRVFIATLAPDESGLTSQDSPDSAQVIESGKIIIRQPGGGQLTEKLNGMSEKELIAELMQAVA
ncbi:MAG: hypothetical protein ABIN55_06470 [Aeromicrobium sp.]